MVAGAGPLEPATPVGATASAEPAAGAAPPAPAVAAALAQPEAEAVPVRYIGLATRVISFVFDAALIDLVALIAGIGASLILSLLHVTGTMKAVLAAIGAAAYILWSVGYFVVLWSTTGQTPGARIMQLRVQTVDGELLKPRGALLRCAGVILAALPLFAGFVLILFDEKRRGLQDRIAGTVVVEAPDTSYIAARRVAARRARTDRHGAERPLPPG